MAAKHQPKQPSQFKRQFPPPPYSPSVYLVPVCTPYSPLLLSLRSDHFGGGQAAKQHAAEKCSLICIMYFICPYACVCVCVCLCADLDVAAGVNRGAQLFVFALF